MGWISKYLGLGPEHLLALAVGALLCLGLSQIVKKTLKLDRVPYLMPAAAFLIGAFATFTMWPPVGTSMKWAGVWAGLIVGIFTPWAFRSFKDFAKRKEWAIARYL